MAGQSFVGEGLEVRTEGEGGSGKRFRYVPVLDMMCLAERESARERSRSAMLVAFSPSDWVHTTSDRQGEYAISGMAHVSSSEGLYGGIRRSYYITRPKLGMWCGVVRRTKSNV